MRDGGKYLIVLNFKGSDWAHYDVGVRGRYQELANTSWPAFNLGNYTERNRGGDQAIMSESESATVASCWA